METWRSTFREWNEDEATPLGLTVAKPHQGVCGVAQFAAGRYPACSEHGAMNRVADAQLWRCLQCNVGVEPKTDTWDNGAHDTPLTRVLRLAAQSGGAS